jgi:DNA anti-recombination protein RmuC
MPKYTTCQKCGREIHSNCVNECDACFNPVPEERRAFLESNELEDLKERLEKLTLLELKERTEIRGLKLENAKMLVLNESREKILAKNAQTIRQQNTRIKNIEQILRTVNRKFDEQIREKIRFKVRLDEIKECFQQDGIHPAEKIDLNKILKILEDE